MYQARGHTAQDLQKILLIDVDRVSKSIMRSLVKTTHKNRLTITTSLRDGVACLRQGQYSVLMFAGKQLGKKYPQAISRLSQLVPNTPIIALGEHISETEGERLLKARAFDYVSVTQFSPELLDRALRHAINSHHQSRLIQQLRDTDPLTGVGNRLLFRRTLESKLAAHEENGNRLAVISIDINNFRSLNSSFGQHNGDLIVIELAERIRNAFSPCEVVARLSSDEFGLIIETSPFENVEEFVTQKLRQFINDMQQPFHFNHQQLQVCSSIGIAISPGHGRDGETLLQNSVLARQASKENFNTSYSFYHQKMAPGRDLYSELAPEIAHALRGNQFILHYQPQINLLTGRIEGAEALIRWQHPKRGLLMPNEFIPICEQAGLIVPIGYWVIHQACIHLQQLKAEGIDMRHFGVNLSFRQFGDDKLVPTIKRILNKTQVDTRALVFELTESALHKDEEHVLACLESLSETGVSFSLDDFGTGYSSFSLLQKLPIDTIKIDRSFITDVTTCADDAEIVRTIINLAHNMGKGVIAEGVERQEQLDFLVEHQCDMVQGYFFSRPVDFDTFRHTVRQCANDNQMEMVIEDYEIEAQAL
ncbi:GGDEF domain-containing response regulator [Neptuniibacter sp. CAU 1671]|uniref:putative bifunctional diguanylate cyclase/phosphodiesterase n=1 Tax=Neptuniibacter sp. CAU 1671 TaxID=3032593 RepID=UPI0023DC1524|nr:GGDEF domain-containing response regulator [Neptuniibacter sp. CAU 1671]MDF2182522.1 GGDEF domain-containing response regulator [Neptuniibacter sp. CAU 1671]